MHSRIALVVALLFAMACKPAPQTPSTPSADWLLTPDERVITQDSLDLLFTVTARDCTNPVLVLNASEASASLESTWQLSPLDDDRFSATLTSDLSSFAPQPATCLLDRDMTLTAKVQCDDGSVRPLEGSKLLRARYGLTASPLASPVVSRRFMTRSHSDTSAIRFVFDGNKITTNDGSLSLVNAVPQTGAAIVVHGDLRSYLPINCNGLCQPKTFSPVGAASIVAPGQLILAPARDQKGQLDARKDVPRLLVPGDVVDLAFEAGVLWALSTAAGKVIVSSLTEEASLSTTAPVPMSSRLIEDASGNYSRAFQFHFSRTGTLVALVGRSAAGDDVIMWDVGTSLPLDETIGGNSPPCPGPPAPLPYPTPGSSGGGGSPSSGGGSTFTLSQGDTAGTISGGPKRSGCIKALEHPSVAGLRSEQAATILADQAQLVGQLDDAMLIAYPTSPPGNVLLHQDKNSKQRLLQLSLDPARPAIAFLTHVTVSPDGKQIVATTNHGYAHYGADGSRLRGIPALPYACGRIRSAQFEPNGAITLETDGSLLSISPR